MKIKKRISFLAIACAAAFLYSCSGSMNPAKLFVKKWQMQSFKSKTFDDQIAMMKQALDTTKDSMTRAFIKARLDGIPKMMDAMKKTVLTCNLDGSYDMASPDMTGKMSETKGKWALIAENKKVVMTDGQHPTPDTLDIESLTSDTLKVSVTDMKGGKTVITYSSVK